MNILFVLYGDLFSNTANPLHVFARELKKLGHECVIAVPDEGRFDETFLSEAFRLNSYSEVLERPYKIFNSGKADIIHACTTRQIVCNFLTLYLADNPTPLAVFMEDNELWLTSNYLGVSSRESYLFSHKQLAGILPPQYSSPFQSDLFLGLSDIVFLIQPKLEKFIPSWTPVKTVFLGVDLERFNPNLKNNLELKVRIGVSDSSKIIVFHGGINAQTLPEIYKLCDAVKQVNEMGIECTLVRTGLGELKNSTNIRYSWEKFVIDLGFVLGDEIPNILALADIYVQPGSINDFEDLRLPGKIPEFLAMGKPLVTIDQNISDLLKKYDAAEIIHAGSSGEIAQACYRLLIDPVRMKKLGVNARKFAEKYFSAAVQAKKLEDGYLNAIHSFGLNLKSLIWKAVKDSDPHFFSIKTLDLGIRSKDYGNVFIGQERGVQNEKKSALSTGKSYSKKPQRLFHVYRALFSFKNNIHKFISISKGTGLKLAIIRVYRYLKKNNANFFLNYGRYSYVNWISAFEPSNSLATTIGKFLSDKWGSSTKVSILMPIYKAPLEFLDEAIWSVRNQIYHNWELCIADDFSNDLKIKELIHRHSEQDSRIKVIVRQENGGISSATNTAFDISTGDYITFLDQDDVLSPYALFFVAQSIKLNPKNKIIYSDEDKIDAGGNRYDPYFKKEFDIDLLLSQNYINHLVVYSRYLLLKCEGLKVGLEGAQDYDLLLRASNYVNSSSIGHIPRILYHWRAIKGSTALAFTEKKGTVIAARKAVFNYLEAIGVQATVDEAPDAPEYNRVKYSIPENTSTVSIVFQAIRDFGRLNICLDSIFKITKLIRYEIIIIIDDDSIDLMANINPLYADRIKMIRADKNYYSLHSLLECSIGKSLCFLNENISIFDGGWLFELVSVAIQSNIGCVGPKIIHSNTYLKNRKSCHRTVSYVRSDKYISNFGIGYYGENVISHGVKMLSNNAVVVSRDSLISIMSLDHNCCDVFLKLAICFNSASLGYRNIWVPFSKIINDAEDQDLSMLDEYFDINFSKCDAFLMKNILYGDRYFNPNVEPNHGLYSLSWPPRYI